MRAMKLRSQGPPASHPWRLECHRVASLVGTRGALRVTPRNSPRNEAGELPAQHLGAAALLNQWHVGFQLAGRGRVGQVDRGAALG